MEVSASMPMGAAAKSAQHSLKRARLLFDNGGSASAASSFVPPADEALHKSAVARRIRMQYPVLPSATNTGTTPEDGEEERETKEGGGKSMTHRSVAALRQEAIAQLRDTSSGTTTDAKDKASGGAIVVHREVDLTSDVSASATHTGVLALPGQKVAQTATQDGKETVRPGGILVKGSSQSRDIATPKWHAPWRLSTVLSSHLGWVRSVAFDPTNDMFATGGADRVIKIFDLAKASVGASDALKLTLTGHISPVRGLAFSDRHPYLFSGGEDKMVKCWDLETNQVIRHYHGHLSGVFCLKLHPTLDILVTGGRDAVARVWDMRSKQQIHCLGGHDNTVGAILTKPTDPQIITASYDGTIKLWDIVAGKTMTTLTHHKKSVRALVQPTFENTFVSGAADNIKKWQAKDGRFIQNFTGHKAVINALAINDDGVLMSGADNGTMNFWDYGTGHCFQQTETIAQPGSLDAENGIYAAEFDLTGTRLITCEADKSVKIWKQDENASELTHPIDMPAWRKKCIAESKQRY